MGTYDYEQLDPESFQELCQALLTREFPGVQCLPVGQRDGGRDAFLWEYSDTGRDLVVFQVKFARDDDSSRDPHEWLSTVAKGEVPKVQRLLDRASISRYVLLTNVRSTAPLDAGSVDKLDSLLSKELGGVPAQCWWRGDLDRRLDNAWDLKWRYPELLAGLDFLRAILELGLGEDRERRASAITAFMSFQHELDREVKFKQIELQNDLVDLFVDVPLAPVVHDSHGTARLERRIRTLHAIVEEAGVADRHNEPQLVTAWDSYYSTPTIGASLLILNKRCADLFPRIVLEGAPGQGKSTLAQYACEVHRLSLLNLTSELATLPKIHHKAAPRIPIKVDLRDYATWLSRRDPFDLPSDSQPAGWKRQLEAFLSHQISTMSGGIEFNPGDLHAVLRISAVLLVLDGLDEVADVDIRAQLVTEVTSALKRLESVAASLLTVITTRPANFANSPGFAERDFDYFELLALDRPLIDEYTEKWIEAKGLGLKDANDARQTVSQRIDEPHLRELARNPMQLAILLSVIHTRGVSLPDKRTALYNIYIDLFFNREAEKDDGVRRHRDLLIDIHGHVAWILQTEAEGGADGRISVERLKRHLADYLVNEQRDPILVNELFREMAQRVLALVSRIEGTLEFEVQPLREYFAARYLYETAPPSRVGAEETGSRPDRFEAVASNFYWLNVARFFAGFYQKGELPSLADQLEELAEEQGFASTSYPTALGVSLLSDWVFSQHPRSMKRVVDLVTTPESLRRLAPSGVGSAMRLPEGNGRAELVQRGLDMLLASSVRAPELEICEVVSSNGSRSHVRSVWLAELQRRCRSSEADDVVYWMSVGSRLDSRPLASDRDLRKSLGRCAEEPSVLAAIAQTLSPGFVYSDAGLSDLVLDDGLSAPAGRGHLMLGTRGGSVRYILATVASPFWRVALSVGSQVPLEKVLEREFPHSPRPASTSDVTQIEQLSSRAQVAFDACIAARQELASIWSSSLRPWQEVVDACVAGWGETRALVAMAVAGAGIRNRDERAPDAADLFDRSVSLVRRCRYARLRSGAGSWWERTLAGASTPEDRWLALSVAAQWMGPKAFLACHEVLDELVGVMEPGEFDSLITAARMPIVRAKASPLKGMPRAWPGTVRVGALVGLRSGVTVRRSVAARLKVEGNREAWALRFRAEACQSGQQRSAKDWSELVDVAKAATDLGVHVLVRADRGDGRAMPRALAQTVASSPQEFPSTLRLMADEVCREALGRAMRPVLRAAEDGEWFPST